jgi:hypothetical protein
MIYNYEQFELTSEAIEVWENTKFFFLMDLQIQYPNFRKEEIKEQLRVERNGSAKIFIRNKGKECSLDLQKHHYKI